MIKSYKLSTGESLRISLISGVLDISELKKKLLDQSLKCCCLTPTLILDTFQIAIAADKASLARSRNKLITKNVYTEILYNLSVSKHITKSLMKFGLQETDQNIIIAVIGEEEELETELSKIKGKQIDLEQLDTFVNRKAVSKEYNVTDEEIKSNSLLNSVITRIATKNL